MLASFFVNKGLSIDFFNSENEGINLNPHLNNVLEDEYRRAGSA